MRHRSIVLDELLRRDGLGDLTTPGMCISCGNLPGEYRCSDCFGDIMWCLECTISSTVTSRCTEFRYAPSYHTLLRYRTFHPRSGRAAFSDGYPSRVSVWSLTSDTVAILAPSSQTLKRCLSSTFLVITLSTSVPANVPRADFLKTIDNSYVSVGTRRRFSAPKRFSRSTFWIHITRYRSREN